ncbi:hypothetical protein ACET3Z_007709 [Daucus carota]
MLNLKDSCENGAGFKPVPVVQKPISSLLEKIRQRKLEVSKKMSLLHNSGYATENDDSLMETVDVADSDKVSTGGGGEDNLSAKVEVEAKQEQDCESGYLIEDKQKMDRSYLLQKLMRCFVNLVLTAQLNYQRFGKVIKQDAKHKIRVTNDDIEICCFAASQKDMSEDFIVCLRAKAEPERYPLAIFLLTAYSCHFIGGICDLAGSSRQRYVLSIIWNFLFRATYLRLCWLPDIHSLLKIKKCGYICVSKITGPFYFFLISFVDSSSGSADNPSFLVRGLAESVIQF